jgi:hypothetical protein
MGEAMAMDSLFMMIVSLLTTFSLGVVKGKEPTLEPEKPSLTVSPTPYSAKVKNLQVIQ